MNKKDTDIKELKSIARQVRAMVIGLSFDCGVAHLGSSLSCVDILVALYWTAMSIDPKRPDDPDRDRFILSKGHAAAALYSVLCQRGFFNEKQLRLMGKEGSIVTEHPGPGCLPGVEVGSGSLGHGLSLGLGMALAARMQKKDHKVFVLMSDGECNEGSVWEAALFAPAKKVDNLVAVIDFNKWQATGRSEEIMSIRPLREKWEKFGWAAYEVDGHDFAELTKVLKKISSVKGKPSVIIANTVKGKGVSFMEDDNDWHYRIPTAEEKEMALKELRQK